MHLVDHAGRGGDEVQVIFAGQPLLDDLEVQEAEEAAAETEAERCAAFGFEAERRIVEAELVKAVAELFEVRGVDRKQAAEDDRLDQLKPGQRLRGGALGIGDRVADAGFGDFLDLRGDEADLARRKLGEVGALGREAADTVDEVRRAGGHELDLLSLADDAVHHPDEDDDAEIGVVPAVDEHRLERRFAVALGRRDLVDDRLKHFVDADA
jgi:hypothetical protein